MEDNNNLTAYQYSDGKTLYEVFQRGLKVSGDGKLFLLQSPPSGQLTPFFFFSFNVGLVSPLQVTDHVWATGNQEGRISGSSTNR